MIIQAETADQIEEVRRLFREYEKWLAIDLCFQGFEAELANLPGKYAEPVGGLFLIYFENRIAGCAALRKIDEGICEIKRLYLREDFRRLGLGKALLEKLIEEARRIGYLKMRLDTLPKKMPKAVALYRNFGFEEISAYYENSLQTTLFMEKNLA